MSAVSECGESEWPHLISSGRSLKLALKPRNMHAAAAKAYPDYTQGVSEHDKTMVMMIVMVMVMR